MSLAYAVSLILIGFIFGFISGHMLRALPQAHATFLLSTAALFAVSVAVVGVT